MLDLLHHLSSGIKAVAIEMVYKGIDELRQGCGGAGFLMSSGICEGWTDYAPLSTLEGVNVVMAQQSARYLFKQFKKLEKGKKTAGLFSYINSIDQNCLLISKAKTIEEFTEIEHLDMCMAIQASAQLKRVSE